MCGIAGILDWRGADRSIVFQMVNALRHRGPDARDVVVSGPIALGHARLAVIDLDSAANQPMKSESGRHLLIFNGEIYNYLELRQELEVLGATFHTHSDTEVLLHACIIWGPDCLQRINGMFAFAFWNGITENLIIGRDRMGEKPIYWMPLLGGGIAFASELCSLRLHPQARRDIEPGALSQFLSLNYVLSDRCIVAGMNKLPPAHFMRVSRRGIEASVEYWNLAEKFRTKSRFSSQNEASIALRDKLDAAVSSRLISDVPLGAFLSGGLDSSAIVEAICRLRPTEKVIALSMGFSEDSYNELPKARQVARYLGINHREEITAPDDTERLMTIIAKLDEPFADTSFIPTYDLCRFARKHVTVALSGDGGDELFAGYETYVADRLHQLARPIPSFVPSGISKLLDNWWPTNFGKVSTEYKTKKFLSGLPLDAWHSHYFWRLIFTEEEKACLLRPEWQELVLPTNPFDTFRHHFEAVQDCHWLDQAMYVDIKTWLVDDILYKVDRASMAHSLEVRAPFLDHRLVEFAASLPPNLKLRGLRKKHLFKKCMQGRLPSAIINAKKEGFSAPVSFWIAGIMKDWAKALTFSGNMAEIFDRNAIERLWREHETRHRDNGLKLYGLLVLALWLEKSR